MNRKSIIIKYLTAYLFVGLAVGSYFPLLTFYLTNELKLSGSETGIITAVTTFAPIFVLPLWGIVTDLVKSPKKTLLVSLFFSSIMIFTLSYIKEFYLFLVLILLFNLLRVPIFSLLDEILIHKCKEHHINFGIFRASNSLGVATSSFIGFLLVDQFGNRIFFILCAIFYMVSFLILTTSKDVNYQIKEKIQLKTDLPMLLKNKVYITICLIWAITYGILDANFQYMSAYLNTITGTDRFISLAIFLSVIIEVPVLYFAKKLTYKFSILTVVLFVNLLSIVRYFIIFSFPNEVTILALAPLHGVTFGLTYPLVIELIANQVSTKVTSTAYTIYYAIGSLLTAIFTYLTGFVSDFNIYYIFILLIVLASLNALFIAIVKRNKEITLHTIERS